MFRIGIGYDVHRFDENPGRKLVLGGVLIDYEKGLEGVSDADVLIHAVMDALLGAAALGDIGVHFPPSEPQYKDIDSCLLLEKVIDLLNSRGFEVGNIDTVIVADKPRLAEYIPKMKENISRICKIPAERVSIKATTEEGLGLSGKGIGSHCACTIALRGF
ncbi:MAG: 2-C-methyl-D-erythritol 2,4-cyclodiphosphate synthase [Oscillospiraceae bacterium]|nr:2-C-methyl-D-erythritol 2,4-cyclodiphosphate synthase [Oscillospiraceae bacterium]